jgi:hypothetical protein
MLLNAGLTFVHFFRLKVANSDNSLSDRSSSDCTCERPTASTVVARWMVQFPKREETPILQTSSAISIRSSGLNGSGPATGGSSEQVTRETWQDPSHVLSHREIERIDTP